MTTTTSTTTDRPVRPAVLEDLVPDDAGIARAIERMLDGLVTVPHGDVQARVRNGVVTLTGSLSWDFLRGTVHNLVGHLRGVRDVVDLISLTEAPDPVRDEIQAGPS